jgi:hypothetical protein
MKLFKRRVKMNKGIEMALAKRTELKNKHKYVWAIDYSINSKYPRLFIFDAEKNKMIHELKCAHGDGGANKSPHDGKCREFSNVSGTHMSNLGFAITQERYNGSNGTSLKLKGLSPTNSRMRSRAIVMHRSDGVVDGTTNICGRSWGCPAMSHKIYLKVIGLLENGAVGYMHHKCEHFEGKC